MIQQAFDCVKHFVEKYNIDESYSINHSNEVMRIANDIYMSELIHNPHIFPQQTVILAASILHDICRHVNKSDAILEIRDFMSSHVTSSDLDIIVSLLSPIPVKNNECRDLSEYQLAYDIIREAYLLSTYDMN